MAAFNSLHAGVIAAIKIDMQVNCGYPKRFGARSHLRRQH